MAEKKIQSSFMIEPSLKERAEKLAEEQGISFGELIRKAILDYVGGDLTTEDEIRELKKEVAELKKRLAGPESDKSSVVSVTSYGIHYDPDSPAAREFAEFAKAADLYGLWERFKAHRKEQERKMGPTESESDKEEEQK